MIGLRAYARHRRAAGLPGGTAQAVRKAIESGRLFGSLTPNGKIIDTNLADREWKANTRDYYLPLTGPTAIGVSWWRILGRNLKAVGATVARESARAERQARVPWKQRRRAAGGCTKCLLPATDGGLCANHATENRDRAAALAQQRRNATAQRLAGAVRAEEIGTALGVGPERVHEWARDGLVPFETQGRKGGRRWFRLADVVAAVGRLNIVNGIVYRPTSGRGRSVALRNAERDSELHTCSSCRASLPEVDFPPTAVRRGVFVCRGCRRDMHAIEREQLSGSYVKDQLTKITGLKADDMPSALIEAHRAHLKVRRLINDKGRS